MILKVVVCFLVSFSCLSLARAACNNTMVTNKVFLDVSIGNEYWGRIVVGLFGDTTPITNLNFETLANNHKKIGYKGTTFNRVYPGMAIQGGDFIHHNGSGSWSIFNGGENFKDENFVFTNRKGWIGMANKGRNSNGCQFFINLKDNAVLDGSYVVFAKVLSGFDVVMKVAGLPLDSTGAPTPSANIVGSGSFPPNKPYPVPYNMPYYY